MNPDHLLPLASRFFSTLGSDEFLVEHTPVLARRAGRMRSLLQEERIFLLSVEEVRELFSDTDSMLGVRFGANWFFDTVLGKECEHIGAVRDWLADLVRTGTAGLTPQEFNRLCRGINSIGPSFISEFLMHRFPDQYWVWNGPVKQFIARTFGEGMVKGLIPVGKKSDVGEEYFAAGKVIDQVRDFLAKQTTGSVDFITVDLFMYWGNQASSFFPPPAVVHDPEPVYDISAQVSTSEISDSDIEKKLARLIPDSELRREWLQIVADAVVLACELSDVNWSLTFPQNGKYLRLNVAKVEVLTLDGRGVHPVVDESAVSDNVIEAIRSSGGNVTGGPNQYKSVPGSQLLIELKFTETGLYRDLLRDVHFAYIRKASGTLSGRNAWWTSHNSGLIDYLNELFDRDLPRPSYVQDAPPQDVSSGRRIWLVAAGPGGSQWEQFLKDGSVRVSYQGLGDLRNYGSRQKIVEALSDLMHNGEKTPFHDALACYQFLHDIAIGDIVLAKVGIGVILGYGIVTGPYEYVGEDASAPYSHRRAVEWKKTGNWPVTSEKKLVTKTLTNITGNRDLLRHIEELLGEGLGEEKGNPAAPVSYWWLNCNPRIWDVTSFALGEEQSYTALNERGNKRRIFEYFEQVRTGDLLIGYETTPKKCVTALLRVTQPLHQSGDSRQFTFEKVANASKGVKWEALIADSVLSDAEPIRNNQGSLFRLTTEEFNRIQELAGFDEAAPLERRASPASDDEVPVVTAEAVAEKLFIAPEIVQRWSNAIDRKKQIIFYGPPGTGKTFTAREFAHYLIGGGHGFVEVVQFHPSYSYEEFMQGIRPVTGVDGTLAYQMQPGVFMNFCEEAAALGADDLCVLILDEINRANLSRVFGELMYLLEYRGESVRLAGDGREFHIPENVRIIGTMNTADRSIALVDHALRRRFAFSELRPEYGVLRAWHRRHNTGFGTDGLVETLENLNRSIGEPHYEVGISFFLRDDLASEIEHIWRMEIEPYLHEFFFDRPERAKDFNWKNVGERIAG